MVFWRMDEVVLDAYGGGDAGAGGGGGKLLARFVNEGAGEGGDGGEGAEGMGMGKVGSVEARWEIGGEAAEGLGSGLSLAVREDGAGVGGGGGGAGRDPFADEGASLVGGAGGGGGRGWREVKVQRKIVSGKYVAV